MTVQATHRTLTGRPRGEKHEGRTLWADRIYCEDHSSAIDGRMLTRAGFRALLRTEKDLAHG
jgi:hypothetical protein